jgi:hypothetical protein
MNKNLFMHSPNKDWYIQFLSVAVLLLILPLTLKNVRIQKNVLPLQGGALPPTPTPPNPFPYVAPKIPWSQSYRILIVGDSIVNALGPNAQLLRQHLIEYYPDHEFVNYNYGFSATSIETLPARLISESEFGGQIYPPILNQGFDIIIVESFAYNPLSQNKDNEGIVKHIKILDESIKHIIRIKPDSVLIILTPISPSREHFARGIYDLSDIERNRWAEERIEYINAVIKYARERNIPLINVYEKSLDEQGEAKLELINPDDYIHPSAEGIDLISKSTADFIYTNNLLPE